MKRTATKGGYPAGRRTADQLNPPPSSVCAYTDEHQMIFGNRPGFESRHEGNPGAADIPERRPKLLRPDGTTFHPDPPLGFTASD